MKLVLLSGGSGKRLWPLSNDARSKQFLKVLQSPQGEPESMVQRVWRQLDETRLSREAYIATSRTQVETLQAQLGAAARLIVEPDRRDTFPAIALSATYLYSIVGASLNEVIVILPVDPYVDGSFFARIRELEQVLDESGADLALIGVKPDHPSEKYGYMLPQLPETGESVHPASELSQAGCRVVSCFREKPGEAEAAQLIAQGALWNCGVFAFRLDYLINLLIALEMPIQYDEMLKQYHRLPMTSFDYAVVEKANSVVVLPHEGEWKDLGTWNTLTEEMAAAVVGNGIVSEDAQQVHIINELEVPVALLGLSNVIVAASPDGILVADKSASHRIKEVIRHLDSRPMFEERRWGQYRVVDHVKYATHEMLTKRIRVNKGKNLSYQYHLKRREVWIVVSGEGEAVLDGKHRRLQAGDVVHIPIGCRHSVRATMDLDLIEVQTGDVLIEEDIIRLEMNWPDILALRY